MIHFSYSLPSIEPLAPAASDDLINTTNAQEADIEDLEATTSEQTADLESYSESLAAALGDLDSFAQALDDSLDALDELEPPSTETDAEAGSPTATAEPDTASPEPTETPGQPGFGIVAVVLTLLGLVILFRRR